MHLLFAVSQNGGRAVREIVQSSFGLPNFIALLKRPGKALKMILLSLSVCNFTVCVCGRDVSVR